MKKSSASAKAMKKSSTPAYQGDVEMDDGEGAADSNVDMGMGAGASSSSSSSSANAGAAGQANSKPSVTSKTKPNTEKAGIDPSKDSGVVLSDIMSNSRGEREEEEEDKAEAIRAVEKAKAAEATAKAEAGDEEDAFDARLKLVNGYGMRAEDQAVYDANRPKTAGSGNAPAPAAPAPAQRAGSYVRDKDTKKPCLAVFQQVVAEIDEEYYTPKEENDSDKKDGGEDKKDSPGKAGKKVAVMDGDEDSKISL